MAIWLPFFIAYSVGSFLFCRWLAVKRVASEKDPPQFREGLRFIALLGVLLLAAGPMGLEIVMRLALGRTSYEGIGFWGFVLGWILALMPGVVVGRRILQAAGINPDE
jgi:hypothetical protein